MIEWVSYSDHKIKVCSLYVRMGVGGGIFSGKPMTQDLAKTTSCEILPCLLQRST